MSYDRAVVRAVIDQVKSEGRTALTALEGKRICDAYGIPTPPEGLATSADEAVRLAAEMGYPVVLKIVSGDILHKTDAGGVLTGLARYDGPPHGLARKIHQRRGARQDFGAGCDQRRGKPDPPMLLHRP